MYTERVYKLTNLGRQHAGSVSLSKRDPLLDALYRSRGKQADTSELAIMTGYNRGQLMGELRSFQSRGFITELTGGAV